MDVYLRISAGELWQKRLMIAGLPKTFEIGRIFRNEGMSAEHAQDYTQIEFYEAFKAYEAGMEMITDLYRTIADKIYGTRVFTIKDNMAMPQPDCIAINGPIAWRELINAGYHTKQLRPVEALRYER